MARCQELLDEDTRSDFDREVDAMREEMEQYLKETGGGVQVKEQQTALPNGTTRQMFTWKKLPLASNVVIDLILKTGAQIFCDEAGTPHLRRPRVEQDTRNPMAWPIRSWETEAWVAKVYYDHGQRPLTAREFQQAARILEGHALERTPPPTLGDMLERDPVLALVVSLLHDRSHQEEQPHWEGTATELLGELRARADEQRLDVARDPDWPRTPTVLSARLARLTEWLAEAGIVYDVHRTQYRRLHRLVLEGAGVSSTEEPDMDVRSTGVPGPAAPSAGEPSGGVAGTGAPGLEEPRANVPGEKATGTGVPDIPVPGTGVPGAGVAGAGVPRTSTPGTNSADTRAAGTSAPGVAGSTRVPGTSLPRTAAPVIPANPKTPGNDAHDAVFDKVSHRKTTPRPARGKSNSIPDHSPAGTRAG